jgi:tetratricopeptide (TPR) repeat protein
MYRQVAELAQFFEPSAKKFWLLQHPTDMQDIVVKVLAGLKDDPENNNVFFAFDAPFNDAEEYFHIIRHEFEEELQLLEPEFTQFAIKLPPPSRNEKGTELERLARRVDAVAKLFPDGTGSLVFLLRPESIGNDAKYAQALAKLTRLTKAPRSKYTLVYFGKSKEIFELAKQGDEFGGQNLQLSPEQIEAQIELDLKAPSVNWFERMQYTAMAGAIAFSKGDLDKAMALQTDVLQAAESKGTPVDIATGMYNLGNTQLKKKLFLEAEQTLTQAAEICLEAENDNLLAMVLINLGVALQRQGKLEEAMTNFDAGRALFKAVNYPAGEIHALDSKAASLAAANKNEEAEQAWREALQVAAAIPEVPLADLRESCLEDIHDKLRRFFEITGQKDKARALPPTAEETP